MIQLLEVMADRGGNKVRVFINPANVTWVERAPEPKKAIISFGASTITVFDSMENILAVVNKALRGVR
jgi:hypothetical protein